MPARASSRAAARAVSRAAAAMERDGAVVLRGLYDPRLIRRMRERVLRLHEGGALLKRGLVRDIGGRYAAVVPFEGPFLSPDFYADGRLRLLLEALLGADYRISSLEAVIARPGACGQHQHIDGPIRFDRRVGGRVRRYRGDLSRLPPYAVTLCVPLCDLDELNGSTEIWAGSHKSALRARPPGARSVGRDFPAARTDGEFGQAYLFDFRVFHGGRPNLSREPRPLLMFVFTRAWYRDPNLLDVRSGALISPVNWRRLPEKHRALFLLSPAARRELWASRRVSAGG